MPGGAFSFSCLYFPFHLPGTQTQYLSTGPGAVWQAGYGELRTVSPGGQNDVLRSFRPGQQVTQDWNAYPLHPQPDVQVLHGFLGLRFPGFPAAFRVGNTLTLSPRAFSDNYPGHFGTGFSGGSGMKVTGSYAIYQNGRQIASGSPVHGIKPVRLRTRPSMIRFTLTAQRQSPMFRFSPQTTTTWSWHSAPQPNATVPRSWSCGLTRTGYQRHCAVQPMMTLNYQVAGLALNGTTAAGPQTVNLSAGHIQLGRGRPDHRGEREGVGQRRPHIPGRTGHAAGPRAVPGPVHRPGRGRCDAAGQRHRRRGRLDQRNHPARLRRRILTSEPTASSGLCGQGRGVRQRKQDAGGACG